MKALPISEPRRKAVARTQHPESSDADSKSETWMIVVLIVLVPALGGACYQAHLGSAQRARLGRELAESRAMVREVVDELVRTKTNLEARETQVESLLQATTVADQQAQELRGVISDWQKRHESLADEASRNIAELAARSAEVERSLENEKARRESERIQLEDNLYAVTNQLSATDSELRDTRDFAREAVQRTEHLERGVYALRSSNESLSSSLSSVQSDLSSARSDASSARSDASSAESERDRARHALGHAAGVIGSLKTVVAVQRREEVREHSEVVRPPIVHTVAPSPPPRAEPPRPPPASHPPEHRDPPGGRRPR